MKGAKTTGDKTNAEPPTDRHDAVMEHVKNGHLTEIFLHDEENRIEQFDEFGEKEEMTDSNHLKRNIWRTKYGNAGSTYSHGRRGTRVIDRLTAERITIEPTSGHKLIDQDLDFQKERTVGKERYLVEEISRKKNHREVIADENFSNFERGTIGHQAWAQIDEDEVAQTDHCCRDWRTHHE